MRASERFTTAKTTSVSLAVRSARSWSGRKIAKRSTRAAVLPVATRGVALRGCVPKRAQVVALSARLGTLVAVDDELQSYGASGHLNLALPEIEWH
jgi:hypothetical protein